VKKGREKMEGTTQAEHFGVLPEPWVNKTKQNKKTPPITHTHLPLSSPQGCERQQGNTGNTLHSGEVSVPCRTWQFLTDRTIYGARERDSRGNRDPTKNILPWLHLKKSFCDQFVNFY
jgi:hypothetical protein